MNTDHVSAHNVAMEEQLAKAHGLIDNCSPKAKGLTGVLLVKDNEEMTVCSLNASHMDLLLMLQAAQEMLENLLKSEIQRMGLEKKDIN